MSTSELQAQLETLQEELNQLKEQKRTEVLQKAGAYYTIVQYYVAKRSEKPTLGVATVERMSEALRAYGKFRSLINATEDPYLISSLCPPYERGVEACRDSEVKGYAERKYRELMSEYYSQQYIDDQLSILEQSREKSAVQKTEEETKEKAVANPEVEEVTPKPKVDITIVVEYEGKWAYQVTTSSSWSWVWLGGSGSKSKVFENIQVPWHYRARIFDEGTGPLVVKIIYNGQVVAEDTATGKDDEAYVFWEGPQ